MPFRRQLKITVKRGNLSRSVLAELSGLHQTYIGLLERGERSPNLDTAKAIANALGLSLNKMIAESERIHKRRHKINSGLRDGSLLEEFSNFEKAVSPRFLVLEIHFSSTRSIRAPSFRSFTSIFS